MHGNWRGLGVVKGAIIPVTCGSALKTLGITSLLDTLVRYFPSPVDAGPAKGIKPGTDTTETRAPEESAAFSALVFKTIADP